MDEDSVEMAVEMGRGKQNEAKVLEVKKEKSTSGAAKFCWPAGAQRMLLRSGDGQKSW